MLFLSPGTWQRTSASGDSLAVAFVIEPPSALPDLARFIESEYVALAKLPEERHLARIDRECRFQRIAGVTVTAAPPPGDAAQPGVRLIRRPGDEIEQTLADLQIPEQTLAVLNWLAEREAAFGAEELAAVFSDIALD